MSDPAIRHYIKIALCEGAVFLAFFWHLVKTGALTGWGRRLFDAALVLLALASVLAYFEFGWQRYGRYMNPHDVYHYYIGAKYSKEHGYFDLYRATLLADRETGARYRERTIRNLNNHQYEAVDTVLLDADRIKAPFTPERWEAFKKDISYFRSVMPDAKWNAVLRDKGYNATPFWNAAARWLTERAPTEARYRLDWMRPLAPFLPWSVPDAIDGPTLLTFIDPVLMAAAFAAIGFTFGWRAMLFAVIFHGLNYFMAMVHIKGAFLRLDWVCALVLSVCALQKRWYAAAGVFAAYAAMTRVFPILFCAGLAGKLLFNLAAVLRQRLGLGGRACRIHRGYVSFFAALAVSAGLLVGITAIDGTDRALWGNFFEKIGVHNKDISTTRAGFKYIFLHNEPNKAQAFDEARSQWLLILAAALLVTIALAWKLEDYEAFAFGFIPVFFFTAPTFYYHVMLLVPLLLFLAQAPSAWRTFGLAGTFALSAAGYVLFNLYEFHFELHYLLSCLLLGLCAYMAGFAVNQTMWALRGSAAASGGAAAIPVPAPPGAESTPGPQRAAHSGVWALIAGFGAAALVCWAGYLILTGERDAPDGIPSAAPTTEARADLMFVGDIMLSRNVEKSVREQGRDFTFPFLAAAPILHSADLVFGNLECPISGRGESIGKRYAFNAPQDAVAGLVFARFDVVSLANNHTLDFGPVALEDTERILTEARVAHIGISVNDSPQTPHIVERNGVRIGFLAYCDPESPYGFAKEFLAFEKRPVRGTREAIARDVAALRPLVDVVVVSMHWGVEYEPGPDPGQIALGRFIVDQGARIVAGHHPHVQWEPEVYNGGIVLHSMGNFVFDQHSRPETRVSRIYRVTVGSKGVVQAEYLPLEIVRGLWQPRPASDNWVTIPLEAAVYESAAEPS